MLIPVFSVRVCSGRGRCVFGGRRQFVTVLCAIGLAGRRC